MYYCVRHISDSDIVIKCILNKKQHKLGEYLNYIILYVKQRQLSDDRNNFVLNCSERSEQRLYFYISSNKLFFKILVLFKNDTNNAQMLLNNYVHESCESAISIIVQIMLNAE